VRTPAAALLLALLCLPGCTGPPPAPALPPGLSFDGVTLQVTTHPDEANEPPGVLKIGWTGPAFAIESAHEPDLARRTVALPDQVDISFEGLGWTRHERGELAAGRLSNRLLLWDLPALLHETGLGLATRREGDLDNTTGEGHLVRDGVALDVKLWVHSRAGVPEEAWLASPQGRESPYRFSRSAALSFPVAAPSPIRPAEEADRMDVAAQQGHVQVIQLVQDYAAKRSGALPDSVDPDTLRLEVLASRKPWPTNPYDGQPLHSALASGQFVWVKCGANDGNLAGYGWDTILVSQSFGAGCPTL
jgi:hypothetical protein